MCLFCFYISNTCININQHENDGTVTIVKLQNNACILSTVPWSFIPTTTADENQNSLFAVCR